MLTATGYTDPPSPPDFAERLAEAEAGCFVSAQCIEEWVASWLTADELPPPDADICARPAP